MNNCRKNKIIIGFVLIFIGLILIRHGLELKEKLNDTVGNALKPLDIIVNNFSYEDSKPLQNFDEEKHVKESFTKIIDFEYSRKKYEAELITGFIIVGLGLSVIIFSDDDKYFWEKLFDFL